MVPPLAGLVLALAASASALSNRHSRHTRRHNGIDVLHNSTLATRSHTYQLVEHHEGDSFFDGFNFYTDPDPTHGLVTYLGRKDATQQKLAYVQDDGTAVLAVDTSDDVQVGGKRGSVRISTKNSWSHGLFIADIYAMAHGCSVWPAYWSVSASATWPDGGEIDIIEGINLNNQNQITMHTGSGGSCVLDEAADVLGRILGKQCKSANGANAGCAYAQEDDTFGHGFNMGAGGVYAHTLEAEGISVWFFPRNAIPADITAKKPNPSSWGKPQAMLPSSTCDIESLFVDQALIFDTTICGDWAGDSYQSSGCPGTCQEAVADPKNFARAQWKIASVTIYQ